MFSRLEQRKQSYSASVGQEVRADGLNAATSGSRKLANSLEVLVGRPAGREGRQSLVDLSNRHIDIDMCRYKGRTRTRWLKICEHSLDFLVRGIELGTPLPSESLHHNQQ